MTDNTATEVETRELLARLIIACAGIITWAIQEGKDYGSVTELGFIRWQQIKEGRWPEW